MSISAANTPDDQILAMIKKKRTFEKGFRLLIHKYQERLYHHVRTMVVDHEDANDVIQNSFVKIYKNLDRFEGKSKLYTWMYRIATNEAITLINRRKRKATDSIDQDDNHLANTLKADHYFDGDAITIQLQQALERLPEKQNIVFKMRYFEEMSYQEISDVLDTSVGALKASYHHAVKKIEVYLKSISNV
ncbi:MAG: sigma-70 family RNA polymerase sigma factor [Bacteroidota bacterium]